MATIQLDVNGEPYRIPVETGAAGGVTVVTLGRAPNCTVSLPHTAVSQLNAAIAWRAGRGHWGVAFYAQRGKLNGRGGDSEFRQVKVGDVLTFGPEQRVEVLGLDRPGLSVATSKRAIIQKLVLNAAHGSFSLHVRGDGLVEPAMKHENNFKLLEALSATHDTRTFARVHNDTLMEALGDFRPVDKGTLDQAVSRFNNRYWPREVLSKSPALRAAGFLKPIVSEGHGWRRLHLDVGEVA